MLGHMQLRSTQSLSVIMLVWIPFSVGCQTLTTASSESTSPTPNDVVLVEVRPLAGKPKRLQLKLTKGMRLQDVVDQSKPRLPK